MKKLMILVCTIAIAGVVNAQKIKLVSGNPSELKSVKEYLVEYDYSDLKVGKMTEEEYIQKKKDEYAKKGEEAQGAEWEKKWIDQREATFHRKFEELFNKGAEKQGVSIGADKADAKYTMIVHTTFIEPGFNVGVTRRPAIIDVEIIFVETANKDKVICKFTSTGNPGADAMGFDFDASYRMGEAYAKCAKVLAKKFYKLLWS